MTGPSAALPEDEVTHRPEDDGAPPHFGEGSNAEVLLHRLELTVRRRLDGLLQGDHLGLVPGSGSEAGDSRAYHPGDDVRRMDWPVTARTQVPHVRMTIADRELETWAPSSPRGSGWTAPRRCRGGSRPSGSCGRSSRRRARRADGGAISRPHWR